MQPLLHDAELVYLYDGSLEGLFSAIFQAFKLKQYPENIVTEDNLQLSLLGSYVPILPNLSEAERVRTSILEKLGREAYTDITQVFLSDNAKKGGIILRYLQYLFVKGRRGRNHLAHPAVAAFEVVLNEVSKEAHYFRQFVRFSQTQEGIFFSKIDPKAGVVPLIMNHFAARFNVQPFMIYDERHQMAGVFDTKRWWLVDTAEQELNLPENAAIEDDFQALWQCFFDTIAIEERRNPVCQRNFMPKRFWGNMCEQIPPQLRKQQPSIETPTKAAKRLASATSAGRQVPLLIEASEVVL
ncbi:MAG: TIGR03915 family putative DNA repair protein [Coriobacteriales bacterium]|jgi:probable DNA metabolism protein|nr:TIGR03915 family putative DNA repair protein [Coriobacteriales bacterium]